MIIYGWRYARIKNYTDNRQCPSCKSFDVSIQVVQQYFHLFWIPFFPISKKGAGDRCNSCGAQSVDGAMLKEYASNAKTPIWFFSGLILIGLIIAFTVNQNYANQREKKQFVQNPKIGDVYMVKDESGTFAGSSGYYFLRISHLDGDSVFVHPNNYVYNKYVSDLDTKDFFLKDIEFAFTKKKLSEMLDKDEIYRIDRDYNSSTGYDRMGFSEPDTSSHQ